MKSLNKTSEDLIAELQLEEKIKSALSESILYFEYEESEEKTTLHLITISKNYGERFLFHRTSSQSSSRISCLKEMWNYIEEYSKNMEHYQIQWMRKGESSQKSWFYRKNISGSCRQVLLRKRSFECEDSRNEAHASFIESAILLPEQIHILGSKQDIEGFKQFVNKNTTQAVDKNIKGENITSKGSEFAKKLTNVGNSVGLTYKGKEYVNSEHAYQTWKSGEFNQAGYNLKGGKVRGGKIGDTFSIMTDILTEKLKQHPDLAQGINERGGLEYLQKSTHNVIGDKFWESTGQNKFIEALIQAYKNISQVVDSGIDAKTLKRGDIIEFQQQNFT